MLRLSDETRGEDPIRLIFVNVGAHHVHCVDPIVALIRAVPERRVLYAINVSVEVHRCICHDIEVSREQGRRDWFWLVRPRLLHVQSLSLIISQRCCRLEGIPDLSPIPSRVVLFAILEVGFGERQDLFLVGLHESLLSLEGTLQVGLPDTERLLLIQIGEVKRQVNSRFERIVKGAYSIGREKQDASVVFEDPKEYCSGMSLQTGVN